MTACREGRRASRGRLFLERSIRANIPLTGRGGLLDAASAAIGASRLDAGAGPASARPFLLEIEAIAILPPQGAACRRLGPSGRQSVRSRRNAIETG
jgi:hypothetical protein